MTRRKYQYLPKHVDAIIVRPFAFEFPDDLEPKWAPDNIVRSHLFNGLSLTMPYLEPYLIKTNQEACAYISDPELLEDMRGFNGQEARHYQCHRRLNELLNPRALGVFHGSFHVIGFGIIGMFAALRKDGILYRPRCIAGIFREILSIVRNVGPYLLRALLPWHNPRCEGDPRWMKDWIAGYSTLPPGALIPLVDTDHPDIPVPFTLPRAD